MASVTYRPEIDGLRALSVVGVVLFHADFGVPGGYVGVDVFFAISGFLITSLIRRELATGTFRLLDFLERRARRILPALIGVLVGVLLIGLIIFLPRDLESLAESTLSQLALASNIYYWRDTAYFGGAAALKPLLHTWSLAVEEQFYLIYPVVLLILRRRGHMELTVWLAVVALGSLVVSIYGTYYHPAATFYLLPTRAWELLAGGLLAIWSDRIGRLVRGWIWECLSWTGLAAILIAMFSFDDSTFFPGIAAMVPVAGTVMFIAANTSRLTLPGRVLALRPLVATGLLSYSWYLWHWPLLVSLHYVGGANFHRPELRVGCLAVSFALAAVSWRFIEGPIRRRRVARTRRHLIAIIVASAAGLLTASGFILRTDGVPSRFAPHILKLSAEQIHAPFPSPTLSDIRADRVPILGGTDQRPICLLWGDSHAIVVRKLVDDLSTEFGVGTFSVAREGTPIVTRDSAERNQAIFEFIARHQVRHVMLVARWSSVYDDLLRHRPYLISREERDHRRAALRSICRKLIELHCTVSIMLEVPCQPGGDSYQSQVVLSQVWPSLCRLERTTRKEHAFATLTSRQVVTDSARGLAELLDPEATCFDDEDVSIVFQEGHALYLDDDHLTDIGARCLLERLWRPVFEEVTRIP